MTLDNPQESMPLVPSRLSQLCGQIRPRPVVAALLALLMAPLVVVLAYLVVPVPLTPLMVIRLIQGEGLHKSWVGYGELSPNLRRAVIASEDDTFCTNPGFDVQAIEKAWHENQKGRRIRGGSTITQQTAKNLFLWPGGGYVRKAVETYPSALIALIWPKRRVMQVYLNIIEFGPGIYGADAASHAFFDRPAAGLTAGEAALMAAVLPNPRRWSPAKPTDYIRERAATILARMRDVPADCR